MENPFGHPFLALAFSKDKVHFTQFKCFILCDEGAIILIFLGVSHFPSDSINTGYHSKFLMNLDLHHIPHNSPCNSESKKSEDDIITIA